MSFNIERTAIKRIVPAGEWRLAVIKDDAAPENSCSMKDIAAIGAEIISASVPGNFELDLIRAGKLTADPYVGDGVLTLRNYEDCHVYYSIEFDWNEKEKNAELVLEGVDTLADVYMNGRLIGSCDNMMIEHRMDAESLQNGKNELFIHIKPVCIDARKFSADMGVSAQKYSYESVFVRKAAHTFGWDIAPRVVSAGLWKPVYFEIKSIPSITETYLIAEKYNSDTKCGTAQLRYNVNIGREACARYSVAIEGVCGESRFYSEQKLWFNTGRIIFEIADCMVWSPRGRGQQNLYNVTVKLLKDGETVDTRQFRFGFRTVSLENSETFDKNGNGSFRFIINDEPVFIMGTNWVPANIFHSKDKERIAEILKLVDECGCNAIRCWGGNVYEDDIFYDLCDEYGFIVWQDFGMACASYPQDERMQKLIEVEAESVIKRLRQHPCICLWAGDNECDIMQLSTRDPNLNILTRQVLPRTIMSHDGTRPYLPSSPYVSEKAFSSGNCYNTTEQHTWGPRDYFKSDYYRKNNACFASEMGYHGCPSPESVKKFIDRDFYWPPENNNQWALHCVSPESPNGEYTYRIPLMTKQVEYLFGTRAENLEDFAAMSQISQAEANKYFIEKFRIRKGHTGGFTWWNIMDCWPQFSDAVVDYYFVKKLAFSYIKISQQQLCFMMDDSDEKLTLYGCNDYPHELKASYKIIDVSTGKTVADGDAELEADSTKKLLCIKKSEKNCFYKINWEVNGDSITDGICKNGVNHYLSFCPPVSFDWYRSCMKAIDEYKFYGF